MTENFMQPPDPCSVIQKHSRSFSLAARFLPSDVRRNAEILYAWCRWCDDAVDASPDRETAKRQLDMLREDVVRVYQGDAVEHTASTWLAEVVTECRIPKSLPMELLDGMEMDLEDYPVLSENDLELYCYRAAGTVGLMMCHVLGTHASVALAQARSLGIAMQLTNIARDVREDWLRGRCYLPRDWLLSGTTAMQLPCNDQVHSAVKQILDMADREYIKGEAGIGELPKNTRVAILLAAKGYREIGNEIKRRDYRVMDGRALVSTWRKLFIVGYATWCGRFSFKDVDRVNRNLLSENTMNASKNDARYLMSLSLSLTLVLATAMFVLMALNPKEAAYSSLPWIYSALTVVGAIAFGWLARRYQTVTSSSV